MKMTIDTMLIIIAYVLIVWGGMELADVLAKYMIIQ